MSNISYIYISLFVLISRGRSCEEQVLVRNSRKDLNPSPSDRISVLRTLNHYAAGASNTMVCYVHYILVMVCSLPAKADS